MALILNLFGQPGAGKSTGASYIFSQLKMSGIKCELVNEFAKDMTWQENKCALADQIYMLGQQYHRIFQVQEKVDVIITDSPIMLSTIYNTQKDIDKMFDELVYALHNRTDSVNIFIKRVKPYIAVGRNQTEAESDAIADKVDEMLTKWCIPYTSVHGDLDGYNKVVELIKKHLNRLY